MDQTTHHGSETDVTDQPADDEQDDDDVDDVVHGVGVWGTMNELRAEESASTERTYDLPYLGNELHKTGTGLRVPAR